MHSHNVLPLIWLDSWKYRFIGVSPISASIEIPLPMQFAVKYSEIICIITTAPTPILVENEILSLDFARVYPSLNRNCCRLV